jgi:ATP-binding cassette subfamily F protein 3
VAPRASNTELRSILGSFLFSEDDVFKQIGVLSGGERNRYALARMLMQPSNFLLLDEPTNHLDMRAKDVLLTALQEFSGTVVFVSHDRYFIDKLATRIFEVEEGRVHVFPGNYEDYLWRKSGGPETLAAQASVVAETVVEAPPEPKAAEKRVNPIKLRQMEERRAAIEKQVSKSEEEIAEVEAALANFVSVEETVRLNDLLNARRKAMESLMAEWEDVVQSIESNA